MANRRVLYGLLSLGCVAAGGLGGAWFVSARLATRIDADKAFAAALQAMDTRDANGLRLALEDMRADPTQTERVLLLSGAERLLVDQPAQALEVFARLNPQGELRLPLLTLTGEALYKQGQFQNAEHLLRTALGEAPDDVAVHRWLATLYYDTGSLGQALLHLGEVSRLVPDDYRPHRMRGVIYLDFGDLDEAIEALSVSLKLAPDAESQLPIRLSLATAYRTLKEFAKGLEILAPCAQTPEVLAARADCHWQMGDTNMAREVMAHAETKGPLTLLVRQLKARALLEDGQPELAVPVLTSLIKEDPADDESEFLLSLAGQQLRDEALHTSHLARAERIRAQKTELTRLSQIAMQEPRNADVREQLAAVCEDLGMVSMMRLWRTAAAACRADSAPSAPQEP